MIERFQVFMDSTLKPRKLRLPRSKGAPFGVTNVFNGRLVPAESVPASGGRFHIEATTNTDPNTFDRTLVTASRGKNVFNFKFDDLAQGPLFLPHLGVAVVPEEDGRAYAAIAAEVKLRGAKTLYDRVAEMPEQTWSNAWAGIPRKKSDIYFPLGPDGGRQRFRLQLHGGRFREALV